jgi:hypothetical protein
MPITDPDSLHQILASARVIAVVGYSDHPDRASYQIGQMLRQVGYTVYPVNPLLKEVDGLACYASLAEVPEPVEIVNVFRRAEFLAGIVDEAAAIGAKAVWGQFGVASDAAARRAEQVGMPLVMDRCIKIEYFSLGITQRQP